MNRTRLFIFLIAASILLTCIPAPVPAGNAPEAYDPTPSPSKPRPLGSRLYAPSIATYTLVGTNSVTLFTDVIPVATIPCTITIYSPEAGYWCQAGVASDTMRYLEPILAGEKIRISPATTTFGVQFLMNATPSYMTFTVFPGE